MVNGISISKPDRLIVWIRNDIRVHDNLALWSATQDASMVVPLFIIDSEFLSLSPFKRHTILNALAGLRDDLKRIGGVLFIRTGEPAPVLTRLMRESGAAGVYLTGSNEPARIHSDERIRSEMESAGKVWRTFPHDVIFGAGEILTSSGTPFKVFTPYRRAWLARRDDIAPPLPSPLEVHSPRIEPGLIPDLADSELPGGARPPAGNEKAGLAALKTFLRDGVAGYRGNRDLPGADGTSRLSHHLAIGSIGVRTVVKAIREVHGGSWEGRNAGGRSAEGVESFLSQIIWRDFYKQILSNFPHVDGKSFKMEYDAVPWKTNAGHFNAWRDGLTGYPIVDAAMRQLKAEGWMHNRGRMVVSGFLTKDLHIDWRMGERHFMEWLADGDLALNNGGWQWSAGTGTDAQPWHRIFNPVLQGRKFDPDGEYVRKYVPELSGVPSRFIHAPWEMPESIQREAGVFIGKGYPAPIVDHAEERNQALGKYRPGRTPAPGRHQ
jgi:deoxyribodipyrimidine photo-lyase